jgi:hypothetical protein
MSLIGSLLGLVLIPLKARREERPKEVENLQVMALADEVRRLNFALDHWRDAGLKAWEENQHLREERNTLILELGYLRTLQQADRQLWAYANQQGLGALDMTSPNYHAALQTWGDCTCTPSRAQAFNRDQAE